MVFWNPDSCLCRIEVDSNFNFIDWEKKCEIHKTINDQDLVTVVLAHNNPFNSKFGNITLNDIQRAEISLDKRNEVNRIKSLGDGIEK